VALKTQAGCIVHTAAPSRRRKCSTTGHSDATSASFLLDQGYPVVRQANSGTYRADFVAEDAFGSSFTNPLLTATEITWDVCALFAAVRPNLSRRLELVM
jgi:hypothetical protein